MNLSSFSYTTCYDYIHMTFLHNVSNFEMICIVCNFSPNISFNENSYICKWANSDMLSGTKISGQLRKNSSIALYFSRKTVTHIFAKKSWKFEIPAVRVKLFCKAVLVYRLRALKTSVSLGTWFLYRVFPVRISQALLRNSAVCLLIHRSEEFRKTTGVLTTLTNSIVDC